MKRIYHTWEKWECYPAGFYESHPPNGMKPDECEAAYAELLTDESAFRSACMRVVTEWRNSCEHYLTNDKLNRIAWMGQAALAIAKGIPACYRGGYNRLTTEQARAADDIALEAINHWLVQRGEAPHTLESIARKGKADIY
jgi:hypothetical protein